MPASDRPPTPPGASGGLADRGPDAAADRRPQRVRCPTCGRTEPRPADALHRLARGQWQVCCGRVMIPVPVDDDTPEMDPDPTPWAERRLDDRRPPRPGARAELRRAGLGLQPDLAVGLVDVSRGGVKVRLRGHARRGDRFQVTLRAPTGAIAAHGPAEVSWCVVESEGTALAGLRFLYPLAGRQLAELAG